MKPIIRVGGPTDFELISKGRDLANELGVNLCGLLLGGEGIESVAKELGGYGADKVIVCESPLLSVYNTDAYAKVICDVIEEMKPEAFLIGATNIGPVTYDPQTIQMGHFDDVTVAIADANYTTPYGSSSYTFSIGLVRQASHCIGCNQCTPHCPQSINIPKELHRIDAYVERLKQETL